MAFADLQSNKSAPPVGEPGVEGIKAHSPAEVDATVAMLGRSQTR